MLQQVVIEDHLQQFEKFHLGSGQTHHHLLPGRPQTAQVERKTKINSEECSQNKK
jgi:hypothetical protein